VAVDTKPCSHTELVARIVALEIDLSAFKVLMNEKDARYALRADTQDKAVAAALETSKTAVNKAELATEKRLEGLNELKGMAENQARTFARAEEVKLVQAGFDKRLDDLSRLVAQRAAAGTGMKDLGAVLIGAGGVAIAAIALFFHH
jgi:hypothetical protein